MNLLFVKNLTLVDGLGKTHEYKRMKVYSGIQEPYYSNFLNQGYAVECAPIIRDDWKTCELPKITLEMMRKASLDSGRKAYPLITWSNGKVTKIEVWSN